MLIEQQCQCYYGAVKQCNYFNLAKLKENLEAKGQHKCNLCEIFLKTFYYNKSSAILLHRVAKRVDCARQKVTKRIEANHKAHSLL